MNNISVGFNVFLGTASGVTRRSPRSERLDERDRLGADHRLRRQVRAVRRRTRWAGSASAAACTSAPTRSYGGAFRIGGGASFLNANRVGVGLDLVLEGGGYHGYWIGGLQLVASPEFHF